MQPNRPDGPPTEVLALPALMAMTPVQLQALISEVHAAAEPARMYMQMSYVFLLFDQHEAALDMQTRALQLRRLYRIQGSRAATLRLLVLMGPGHMQDNTPIEFVVHTLAVQTEILYLLPGEEVPRDLPAHDVAFVAVGESDKNAALLARLQAHAGQWPAPLINQPGAIGNGARDRCYQLLKGLAGVHIAPTQRLRHGDVPEMDYPLTLRPVDSQGGEGLQRIDHAGQLADYYASVGAECYYAARFVDYRSEDGLYRKMRIVLIDGLPYICHLAISEHWMVHYRSAAMAEHATRREEEQRFMEGFAQGFALRMREPLAAIAQALQLDYVTVDCALAPDGALLVFEVDSRGLVHATDAPEIYPYKPAVMQQAFDAFEAMLHRRLGR